MNNDEREQEWVIRLSKCDACGCSGFVGSCTGEVTLENAAGFVYKADAILRSRLCTNTLVGRRADFSRCKRGRD